MAAILIPGCVLAYFSVQNVGSQKELAEKRLQEEEQGLAAELGTFLRDELVKTATAFFTAADGANPDLRTPALPAETRSYVARAFALDAAGGFLWPRYVEARAAGEPAPESTRALALLSGAETAEFRSKNLDEAARLYREAAGAARQQSTRAAATNGLARVLAKSGRTEQAVSQYELLLERYGSLRDQDGVAFARYALHQLTRIRADDPAAVARPLSVLLSRLESGEEPLTDQTEPLLQDVEDWLKRNPGGCGGERAHPARDQRAAKPAGLRGPRREEHRVLPLRESRVVSHARSGILRRRGRRGRGQPETLHRPAASPTGQGSWVSRSISNTCAPCCWNEPPEHPRGSRWRWTSSRGVTTRVRGRGRGRAAGSEPARARAGG